MHRVKKYYGKLPVIGLFIIMMVASAIFLIRIIEKKQIIEKRRSFIPMEINIPGNLTYFISNENKSAPYIILFFDPDCYYCHVETEALLNHTDELTGIKIYMISTSDINSIATFSDQYNLSGYTGLIAGQVCPVFFNSSYGLRTVPSLFLYDKNGILIYSNSGYTPVTEILEVLRR